MKLAVINRCEVCPYMKVATMLPRGGYKCLCMFDKHSGRKIEDASVIPDWCPLEDADEAA